MTLGYIFRKIQKDAFTLQLKELGQIFVERYIEIQLGRLRGKYSQRAHCALQCETRRKNINETGSETFLVPKYL